MPSAHCGRIYIGRYLYDKAHFNSFWQQVVCVLTTHSVIRLSSCDLCSQPHGVIYYTTSSVVWEEWTAGISKWKSDRSIFLRRRGLFPERGELNKDIKRPRRGDCRNRISISNTTTSELVSERSLKSSIYPKCPVSRPSLLFFSVRCVLRTRAMIVLNGNVRVDRRSFRRYGIHPGWSLTIFHASDTTQARRKTMRNANKTQVIARHPLTIVPVVSATFLTTWAIFATNSDFSRAGSSVTISLPGKRETLSTDTFVLEMRKTFRGPIKLSTAQFSTRNAQRARLISRCVNSVKLSARQW